MGLLKTARVKVSGLPWLVVLIVLCGQAVPPRRVLEAAQETAGRSGPVTLTSEDDQRRTLDLLGIQSLRRGANGSDPEAENFANYDEVLANPYPSLPDPLLLNDWRPVVSPEMWWNERRPEIVELFDRYELLGGRGLATREFPAMGTGLVEGDVAFRQHDEGHTDRPNWPVFLEFADRYIHPARRRRGLQEER